VSVVTNGNSESLKWWRFCARALRLLVSAA